MCQIIPFRLPCCDHVYVRVERLPSCHDEWPKYKCPPELCIQLGGYQASTSERKRSGVCWRCKAERQGKPLDGREREAMRPGIDRAPLCQGLEELDMPERRARVEQAGDCWFCGSKSGCKACGSKEIKRERMITPPPPSEGRSGRRPEKRQRLGYGGLTTPTPPARRLKHELTPWTDEPERPYSNSRHHNAAPQANMGYKQESISPAFASPSRGFGSRQGGASGPSTPYSNPSSNNNGGYGSSPLTGFGSRSNFAGVDIRYSTPLDPFDSLQMVATPPKPENNNRARTENDIEFFLDENAFADHPQSSTPELQGQIHTADNMKAPSYPEPASQGQPSQGLGSQNTAHSFWDTVGVSHTAGYGNQDNGYQVMMALAQRPNAQSPSSIIDPSLLSLSPNGPGADTPSNQDVANPEFGQLFNTAQEQQQYGNEAHGIYNQNGALAHPGGQAHTMTTGPASPSLQSEEQMLNNYNPQTPSQAPRSPTDGMTKQNVPTTPVNKITTQTPTPGPSNPSGYPDSARPDYSGYGDINGYFQGLVPSIETPDESIISHPKAEASHADTQDTDLFNNLANFLNVGGDLYEAS